MRKYCVYDATKNLYLVKVEQAERFAWGNRVNRFGSALLLNEEQARFWVSQMAKAYGRKFVALAVG